jgi:CBS domain-containing protein
MEPWRPSASRPNRTSGMNDPGRGAPAENFGVPASPPTFVSPYEEPARGAIPDGIEGPRVREIMTTDVKSCRPERSLVSAASAMHGGDVRFLPVVDDQGRPIAVITDGDVCEIGATDHRPLRDILVSEAMSREVFTCHPDDRLGQVLETMKLRRIRHLPVVDDGDGRLVGVVSLTDVILGVEEGGRAAAESLRPRIVEVLRVISQKEQGTRTVRVNPFRED